jgi:hypothetical protein
MKIIDMPAEILRAILVQAVIARGVKRGLRLRLVNRKFSLLDAPMRPLERYQKAESVFLLVFNTFVDVC